MDLPVTMARVWPSGAVQVATESSSSAGVSADTKLSGTSSTFGAVAAGVESGLGGTAEAAGWLAQAASSSAIRVAGTGEIRIREVCGMGPPRGKGKFHRFMRMKGLTSPGTAAKLDPSIQTG
ncbi:hypothetical protein GCM10025793_12340 [Lysobacter lycopersici]